MWSSETKWGPSVHRVHLPRIDDQDKLCLFQDRFFLNESWSRVSLMTVSTILRARRSVRRFRETPVDASLLQRIFHDAQSAPSWCNIQPWRVWVLSGSPRRAFAAALRQAAMDGRIESDFPFPSAYPAPYDANRRACGLALYSALGINKDDKAARTEAWFRNFDGFGAPHMVVVAVDRRFDAYGSLDIGCWLQSVLLRAEEAGVSTCAQASIASVSGAVREFLEVPKELGILVGIAMGYADETAPENNFRTERGTLTTHVQFLGVAVESAS